MRFFGASLNWLEIGLISGLRIPHLGLTALTARGLTIGWSLVIHLACTLE